MPYADPRAQRAAQARYRASHAEQLKAAWKTQNAKRPGRQRGLKGAKKVRDLPFVGVDGEGGGTDSLGRQNYLLLRAGDRLLFRDNQPLTTAECLEFLADLPAGFQYVSYFFDYDVTMILRDLSEERVHRLLTVRDEKYDGKFHYNTGTVYKRWEVEYIAGKRFSVRRWVPWVDPDDPTAPKRPPWVQIHDVGSFFQCPFCKRLDDGSLIGALPDWSIGSKRERQQIATGKARREDVSRIGKREIAYNAAEVRALAELMTEFRQVCVDTEVPPDRWEGPGGIAVTMFKTHGVPRRKETPVPEDVNKFAMRGYIGGRFEVCRFGSIGPVWEHDKNSAYVEAMLGLPCLLHGRWVFCTPSRRQPRPEGEIWAADVSYRHPKDAILCHLPHRQTRFNGLLAVATGQVTTTGAAGTICWPCQGRGVYWASELLAAEIAGTTVKFHGWMEYHRECDCDVFGYVRELYRRRLELKELPGNRGAAFKLGLNSQPGKTMQSIGSAPYGQPIWGGMITAHTRAAMIDAASRVAPEDVVMIATDGIYTRVPIPELEESDGLGAWRVKRLEEIFVMQPGLYFASDGKPKTRGIRRAAFEKYEAMARAMWADWLIQIEGRRDLFPLPDGFCALSGERFPTLDATIDQFIGLRLAYARGKLATAGTWVKDASRKLDFRWTNKRAAAFRREGDSVLTLPQLGGRDWVSAPYERPIGALADILAERDMALEAMPDWVDLVAPPED